MANISQFKVYGTEPHYRVGYIYSVLTGTKNEETSFIETEWFYYIKKLNKMDQCILPSTNLETIEQVWKVHTEYNLK